MHLKWRRTVRSGSTAARAVRTVRSVWTALRVQCVWKIITKTNNKNLKEIIVKIVINVNETRISRLRIILTYSRFCYRVYNYLLGDWMLNLIEAEPMTIINRKGKGFYIFAYFDCQLFSHEFTEFLTFSEILLSFLPSLSPYQRIDCLSRRLNWYIPNASCQLWCAVMLGSLQSLMKLLNWLKVSTNRLLSNLLYECKQYMNG